MKNELIISYKDGDKKKNRGSSVVDHSYIVTKSGGKKYTRTLTDAGEVVEKEQTLSSGSIFSSGATVTGKDITIDSKTGGLFRMDVSLDGINEEKIIEWAKDHPYLNGNSTMFKYYFSGHVVRDNVDADDQKADVLGKFKSLGSSPSERRTLQEAVSVHFGVSPFGLSDAELQNVAVGLSNGVINSTIENRTEFLNRFENIFEPTTLNLRAALLGGVVVDRDGVFILDTTITLGTNFEQSVAMLRSKSDYFSIMERKLRSKGQFIETKGESKTAFTSAESFTESITGENSGTNGRTPLPQGEFRQVNKPDAHKKPYSNKGKIEEPA